MKVGQPITITDFTVGIEMEDFQSQLILVTDFIWKILSFIEMRQS